MSPTNFYDISVFKIRMYMIVILMVDSDNFAL